MDGISLQHIVTRIKASSQKRFEMWIILKVLSWFSSEYVLKKKKETAFFKNLCWTASMLTWKNFTVQENTLRLTLLQCFKIFVHRISSVAPLKLDLLGRWFWKSCELLQQTVQPSLGILHGDRNIFWYTSQQHLDSCSHLWQRLSTLCTAFCCCC